MTGGRPRWWLPTLALVVLLVLGGVVWTAVRDDSYTAPRPTPPGRTAEPVAAAEALARLETAVRRRDAGAARDLAPAGDREARTLLGDLVRNAAALDVTAFRLRYVDEAGAVSADGAWSGVVDTSWQLAGFDDRPAETEVLVGLVAEADRVAIASLGGGDLRTPVWLADRVRVLRAPGTLVVDAAGDGARVFRLARAALPVVRRVLPQWRGPLVVEVPATAAGLDAALAAADGQYAGVAAVTTAADGTTGEGAPVHVFVNPRVLADLGPVGAQVVMSHEATHVATVAAGSTMPLWLLEGFADYVALRDVRLPESTVAAQIARQVRRRGVPDALPGPVEFETTNTHLGAAYESAWLACEVLAEIGGEPALVVLYESVNDGGPLDAALRASFGFGERELIRRWRARLSDLAG